MPETKPWSLLDQIEQLMLPATLDDCVEAHREQLLEAACAFLPQTLLWCFQRDLSSFRARREDEESFADIFDPFLGELHTSAKLPVGKTVELPPLPIDVVARARTGTLEEVAARELHSFSPILGSYDENELAALYQIACAGYLDTPRLSVNSSRRSPI